jgi:hypothetical protein
MSVSLNLFFQSVSFVERSHHVGQREPSVPKNV